MTTFTARNPTDLLALVPVVIGFHPEDSAVLLTFGTEVARDGRATSTPESFQARVDLPVVEHEQRAVAEMLRDVVRRHRVGVVALVLYSHDAEVAGSFASLLVPGLIEDEVEVVDVLRADGERYFRVVEPEDQGVAYDLGSHPLTAAGVLEGRVVHDSRSALRDTLVGSDETEVLAVEEAAEAFAAQLASKGLGAGSAPEHLAGQGRWLQRTLRRRLVDPGGIPTAEAGRILVLLSLEPLREVAWSDLTRANAGAYVDLLRALVRRAPADLVAGAGGLLGLAAWLQGDGALSWCALDRCLAACPDDHLAHHVAALLESATPPSVWAPLPADGLPVFARERRPGFRSGSPLGSSHGAGRRRAGVQPG